MGWWWGGGIGLKGGRNGEGTVLLFWSEQGGGGGGIRITKTLASVYLRTHPTIHLIQPTSTSSFFHFRSYNLLYTLSSSFPPHPTSTPHLPPSISLYHPHPTPPPSNSPLQQEHTHQHPQPTKNIHSIFKPPHQAIKTTHKHKKGAHRDEAIEILNFLLSFFFFKSKILSRC